jgi:hypothetical protein
LTNFLILSMCYAAIGWERYSSAIGVFAPLAAIVTEAVRYKLCHWILSAEAFFQQRRQTLVSISTAHSYEKRLMSYGSAVGLGMGLVYSCVTVGSIASAEGSLTWVNHGSSTGGWMPSSVESTTWVDIDNCPQLPKLASASIQSLFACILHVLWSTWMLAAVDCIRRATPASTRRADRVPLTPSARDHGDLVNGVELDDHSGSTSTSPPSAEVLSEGIGWRMSSSYGLVASVVVLHTTLRFVSLAGSRAGVWDAAAQHWELDDSRGCVVVMSVQAMWVVLSAGVSMLLWRSTTSSTLMTM